MARSSTFVVKFRRRRQGKTDYKKRLQYLKSNALRFVVRTSNKHCLCQVIKYSHLGDITLAVARSKELDKYGYKGNTGNRKAAYLTGYLCAKRSANKKMILDIGLHHPHPKGRIYSALRGAIDAGLNIASEENILPDKSMFAELKNITQKIDKSADKKKAKPKTKKPKKKKKVK